MDSIKAKPGTFSVTEAPTPHGGVKTVVYFFDKEGEPCLEAEAAKLQILEYDASGICVFSLISET